MYLGCKYNYKDFGPKYEYKYIWQLQEQGDI